MSWPQPAARIWEKAPVLRLLLPFLAGIYCYECLLPYTLPAHWLHGLLPVFCGLSIILLLQTGSKTLLRRLQWFAAQCCLFLLGLVLCDRDAGTAPVPGQSKGCTLAMIAAPPEQRAHTTRLTLQLLATGDTQQLQPRMGKALLYLHGRNDGFHQGDTIIVPAQWQAISNSGNPFSFDYAAYCRHRQIQVRQFATARQVYVSGRSNAANRSWLESIHQFCIRQLEQHIKDPGALALLKSMIAGDESDMDPELRQAYSDTGIIHIVSISGAHVSLLFGLIAFLLRWIRNRRYSWIQYLLSFAFIWTYVLMAGAAPPAVRAALMFSIVALGSLINRQTDPLNQLCTAALLMLIYKPFWLFAAGFQLSFLAIASLMLFYKPISGLWQPGSRLLHWLWNLVAASLAAELLIAPLCAYYFHSFPPMFILANIVACLAMSVVLVSGMLLILFTGVPLLNEWIAQITETIILVFHRMVFLLQSISPESFGQLQLDRVILVSLYVLIAGLAFYLVRRSKQGLYAGIVALSALTTNRCIAAWKHSKQRLLIVYNNSGSCDAALISGRRYIPLCAKHAPGPADKAAFIGFGCSHADTSYRPQTLIIGKRKVILWNAAANLRQPGTPFPADVLVVYGKADTADIEQIGRIFTMQYLVLGNDQPRKNIGAWRRFAGERHIGLHYTPEAGAYILQQ